jgi:oligopeptide/dipeptide ABC transporter ATP-binding protein
MALLEINNLKIEIPTSDGTVRPVNGLNLMIRKGEAVALVGESGSGKSITARAILGLIPPPGKITSGSIRFEDRELVGMPEDQLRQLRGSRIAMIFQEPMTSLNPVLKIVDQISEPLILHRRMSKKEARAETVLLMQEVGIPNPEERIDCYPHQLSGGMRQRVMIAMALACKPALLIADEPTTALDVTIQAQILSLMDSLRRSEQLALLLITHDFGVVAERTDRVMVIYAGRIVESALTADLIANPLHPYSKGLIASLPENCPPGEPLPAIEGQPPNPTVEIKGCPFTDRCPYAFAPCPEAMPDQVEYQPGHFVRCWKYL